jgi:transposase-like protein
LTIGGYFRPQSLSAKASSSEAENDVLAYLGFHADHRTKLHSTNPLDRLNGEIKRRTNVVGIFPNEAALVRLVGAILLEQNDEWTVTKRYLSLETMVPMSDNPDVTPPALAAA